jgi:hypothetical protein
MKKKNNIWIYGLIGGVLIFGLIFGIMSINFKDKNTGTQDLSNLNSNVSTEVTEPTLSETPTEPPKSIVESVKDIVSTDFKGDLKSILPTIDDFNMGWQIEEDKSKDNEGLTEEQINKRTERGFKEGYYRSFEKGSWSLATLQTYELVGFSVSVYTKEGVQEILAETNANILAGSITTLEPTEQLEYNDEMEEYETITIDENVTEKLAVLKNPNIGSDSVFYSSARENEYFGEFKKYYLEFTKKNVWVKIICYSGDSQKAIDNCINWAEFVDKKI